MNEVLEVLAAHALQVGDHQYVNYAIIGDISLHFSRGMPLTDFIALCRQHEDFVMKSKDVFPMESFLMWKNCALALLGETEEGFSLNYQSYNEKVAEDRYRFLAILRGTPNTFSSEAHRAKSEPMDGNFSA